MTEQEIVEKIRYLRHMGTPMGKIAEALGLNYSSVRKIMIKHGIPTGYTGSHIPIETQEKVVIAFKNGMTRNDILKQFGISYQTIFKILDRFGVDYKYVKTYDTIEWSRYDIKALLDEHKAVTKVSEIIGIKRPYIDRYIRENGITFDHMFTFYEDIPEETKRKIFHDYMIVGMRRDDVLEKYNIIRIHLNRIMAEYNVKKKSASPVPPERKEEFAEYTKKVRRLSQKIRKCMGHSCVKGKHWNHRLSVVDGFMNDVPVEIISSMVNQELIDESENLSLNFRSKITKEQLIEDFIASMK